MLYLNIAIAFIRLNDYKNAIAACTFVLDIDPNSTKVMSN